MENKQISKSRLQSVIKELLAKYCDECGHKYTQENIRILQSNKANTLVHLFCKNCGKTHMAHISLNLGISNRTPIKSDLNPVEFEKFAGSRAVSSDDVLDVYEWTKKLQGRSYSKVLKELIS